jgi:two-component system LytT family sensor kinase
MSPLKEYKSRDFKFLVLRHCLIWLIFITYEIAYIYFTVGIKASILHFAVYYCLNILLFYCNAKLVLDYAFFKTQKPYLIAILLIITELIIYLLIKLLMDIFLSDLRLPSNHSIKYAFSLFLLNIWRGIYFVGFSCAYWAMGYFITYKEKSYAAKSEHLLALKENLELENRLIAAENAYLQNQVSPHLLFNTLNFIYNAIYKLSDKAGEGILLLADILRYSLENTQENRRVLLTREMEQVQNLIQLNKLRFDNMLYLELNIHGEMDGVNIIPLILITLVENMLKHGNLSMEECPAKITLEVKYNCLRFTTFNLKRTGSLYSNGGIGLKNVRKRLNNDYNSNYILDIINGEDDFTANLELYL